MTRLIDADDLMDWSEIVPLTGDGGIDINDFEEKLKSMPTIDAVPVKHGKWMEIIEANELGELYQPGVYCSECGYTDCYESNFCPDCGADMRMEKE